MRELLILIFLLISLSLLSSCSTARGVAEDMGKAAAVISTGAKKAHKAMTDSYKEKKEEIEKKEQEETE